RISAFLSAPERYQLVISDYFRAGLFRSHGHRGAAYLFLRWCCDRYGNDLLKQLVQTNLTGTANLEAATHERFADLFRQWTIALALSGTNLGFESDTRDSKSEIRTTDHTEFTDSRKLGSHPCNPCNPWLEFSDFGRKLRGVDIRQPLAGRLLCGPRFEEMALGGH